MDKQALNAIFEKYIRKLRITPAWDLKYPPLTASPLKWGILI